MAVTHAEAGYPLTSGRAEISSTPSAPVIDVVIVTAKGSWTLVHDCLLSLQAHPPRRAVFSICIVDNASRDGIVEAVRREHPRVTIEELAENRGFAYGCNVGIRRSTGPYVLLLNPDTIIREGAVDLLLDVLDHHSRAAVVGPRLVGPDGSVDHNAKRSFPTPAGALAHFAGWSSGGYARADITEAGAGPVDAVSGSCMLVRRAAIAEVGLLDEGYWMYGEDLDWCRRFGQAGWEVRYEGSATILHVKHGVTGRHRSLRTNWAFHRAMGRFYRRFDAGDRPLLDIAVFAAVLAKFTISALRSAVARSGRMARHRADRVGRVGRVG